MSNPSRFYFFDLETKAELRDHPLNGSVFEGCGAFVSYADKRLIAREEIWIFRGKDTVRVTADDFGGRAVGVKQWSPAGSEKFFLVPAEVPDHSMCGHPQMRVSEVG
jgi:hypothetical protein